MLFPKYSSAYLRFDVVAGLTAAAVVIPKAMAYSTIAGLPIQAGLYTALAAMLVYPLIGTSRVLSVTTTSTIALMTAAQIMAVTQGGSSAIEPAAVAVTLALLVGVFMILARILRMGFLANFISKPILVGFEAGIAVVILISQIKSLLGVHLTGKTSLEIFTHLPGVLNETHPVTAIVALVGILIMAALPRLSPKLSAPLVLVALAAAASYSLGLGSRGVALVGEIPTGLPALAMPDLSLARLLWPAALGITLMSFTESVASARTLIKREDPPLNLDRELLAVGAANIASAFAGGIPAGGGASQTAVNSQAGACSQAAQWVTALVVVLCLLFLSKPISYLPQAALAALVMIVALHMISPSKFRAIAKIRKVELIWALITMAGVIFIGTLEGILIAAAISILTLFYQANHPPVYAAAYNEEMKIFRRLGENAADVTFPGLLILRTEGRLHFANAERVAEKMRVMVHEAHPKVVVLECSAIPDIEYTALLMLTEREENLRKQGIELWLAALNPDILKVIERSPLGAHLGRERMFFNLHKALEAYKNHVASFK